MPDRWPYNERLGLQVPELSAEWAKALDGLLIQSQNLFPAIMAIVSESKK